MQQREVGAFLRARRARIQPAQVGLATYGRRRVPGLRREELARLAGVSTDYYVRLEQGRSPHASDAVLDSIARVLRLDDTERAHLRNLITSAEARRGGPSPQASVRPGLRRMLELMPDVPAFVSGRYTDYLAWTALGDAVLGITDRAPRERNGARQVFLDPSSRELFPDWADVAEETVGYLRLAAGRNPDDPRLSSLVGELSVKSADFRRVWARQTVRDKTTGKKRVRHPVVGELEFDYEALATPGDGGQLLVAYTFAPDSPTDERLRLLSSWSATTAP
ncbi:helix-turn-helix transcriptional regulator [Rugosimonospora acidiphila]|uniref:Helix-turn-helix transcriptional regulator n=1 Tax=Rugosimonospora acidiphila TaxID=556531 RepID=A0ABP9RRF4_9ACTN